MNPALAAAVLTLGAWFAGTDLFDGVAGQYTAEREFISPVSGVHFVADVLVSPPRVQSFDYDRCPHSAINTLYYELVIDPATGYVETPDRFVLPAPWTADEVRAIVGTPRFHRNTPEGWDWSGAYAWEKYENAARLAEAAGRPKAELANFWLLAGWSVRIDFALAPDEFREEVEGILEKMPPVTPQPGELYSVYELQLADYWAALDEQGLLTGQPRRDSALAIGWLYRSRGELAEALHWLRVAAAEDPALAEQSGGVYAHLQSSIRLESDYLASARRLLAEAWTEGTLSVANEGGAAFLLGELNRRLGYRDDALYWYDLARDHNRGAVSTQLIERQRQLSVEGHGY